VSLSSLTSRAVVVLSAFALAACAAQSGALPPTQSNPMAATARASGPKPCKNQTTTSLFSNTPTLQIKSKAGTLCIPAFDGFGGRIAYPAGATLGNVTLTSSTTNYNKMLPVLTKGKPIFYLQMAMSAPADFATKVSNRAALISKRFVPGTGYDVYGQAKMGGVVILLVTFTPCEAVATSSAMGGVLHGIGTLFAGQNLSQPPSITIEVFPHKRITAPC